jgi:drug/metabolite transporter (DMT)-like permease
MLLLLLCILANVSLGLLFKVFVKYDIRNLPAIVINYMSSIAVGSIMAGKLIISKEVIHSPGIGYIIALSVLFIVGFNVLGKAFQIAGMSLTTIIQKMSILISAIFAIVVYNDLVNIQKILGLTLAVAAIVFVYYVPKSERQNLKKDRKVIAYPLIAFLLSGIIEVILLVVGKEGLMTDSISFVSHAFALASIIGIVVLLVTTRPLIKSREILAGIVLGIPNFFTIYLLIVLVEQGWDGSVLFPINNIGIVILSALAGVLLFHEKLDKYKRIGLGLALFSIILIGMELF